MGNKIPVKGFCAAPAELPDWLPGGGVANASSPLKQFTCIARKTVGQFKKATVKGKFYCPANYSRANDKVAADVTRRT